MQMASRDSVGQLCKQVSIQPQKRSKYRQKNLRSRTTCLLDNFLLGELEMSRVNPQHGQARPRTSISFCKHIFEQDKQTNYVSVLVLLLSLRYYVSLWKPIGS